MRDPPEAERNACGSLFFRLRPDVCLSISHLNRLLNLSYGLKAKRKRKIAKAWKRRCKTTNGWKKPKPAPGMEFTLDKLKLYVWSQTIYVPDWNGAVQRSRSSPLSPSLVPACGPWKVPDPCSIGFDIGFSLGNGCVRGRVFPPSPLRFSFLRSEETCSRAVDIRCTYFWHVVCKTVNPPGGQELAGWSHCTGRHGRRTDECFMLVLYHFVVLVACETVEDCDIRCICVCFLWPPGEKAKNSFCLTRRRF